MRAPGLLLRLAPPAVALGVLVACGGQVKQSNWGRKSAKVSCKFAKRCDTANFHFQYESLGQCVDESEAEFLSLGGYYDACDYDPGKAARCLDAMNWSCKKIGSNYDDLLAACFDVWICEDPFPELPEPGGDTGL